ncbi:nucleic acid/nucleotide deaminase domain-containing protein [Leptolyngbya sp. GGD]|uniref:nucleic acid/nucleotide deaminase domain-containing protein n=1 Tax=Leptolyngbya sp. GGD TaxID=2997907 RepID=UPI002DD62A38|nr:nucleic acid/nucleotide deaminase domain-containing protein [Leptolyngbya sp. GGD]
MNMVQVLAILTIASTIANIFNPFNIGGINPLSTDIFSEIDPTRGLGGQINFNPAYDFVQEAILYRGVNQVSKTRNVAVFQYRDASGKLHLRATENVTEKQAGVAIHAEYMIGRELQSLGIHPKNVTRIYSEFEPCSATCADFLRTTFPQAKVYWTYPYNNGMNTISRDRKYLDFTMYGVDFK